EQGIEQVWPHAGIRAFDRGNARLLEMADSASIYPIARLVRAFGVGVWMTGTTLSSDGLDLRRRKLLFHAWHRGMRETDLILGRSPCSPTAKTGRPDLAN